MSAPHHYFASTALDWCSNPTIAGAQLALLSRTNAQPWRKDCQSIHFWLFRVPGGDHLATYPIDNFRPQVKGTEAVGSGVMVRGRTASGKPSRTFHIVLSAGMGAPPGPNWGSTPTGDSPLRRDTCTAGEGEE